MNSPANLKRTLRSEARKRRDQLDSQWRAEASESITRRAMELPELKGAQVVSSYVSTGTEVETGALLAELFRLMGCVALPRMHPDSGILEHWLISAMDAPLRPGAFGILEPDPDAGAEKIDPSRINVNFLPGLAFDARGNRLGMGGGHYDRYLAASPQSRKFGLAYSSQILAEIPVLATDIRMHGVITENRTYDCSDSGS